MMEKASLVLVFWIGKPVATVCFVIEVGDLPENSFIPHGWFQSM